MIVQKRIFDVFARETSARFESRQIAHLRNCFPQQTADATDSQIAKFIREGVVRAAKYDVIAEDDIERFLEYRAIYGLEFDVTCDWASRILQTEGVSGTRKMDWIDDYDQYVLNRPGPSAASLRQAPLARTSD